MYALLTHFVIPQWALVLFILSGIYLYCVGAVLQFFPALGRRT
jgi:phosphatidylcholine synthase